MQFASLQAFLTTRSAFQNRLQLELAFVDMTRGDHIAALMLTQIVDWYAAREAGRFEGEVCLIDDASWLVVPWDAWWRRTRVTPRQGRRSLKTLESLDYVVCRVLPGNGGGRKLCVRLVEHRLLEQWSAVLNGQPPTFEVADWAEDA